MPTLDWIGKKAVVRHHTEVPFHLLKEEPTLSCGGEDGAGNLIVQGDNLKALKALLPHYAGQVKCIYIDPPYNTGNEGWVYNDNVNSPEIRQWLESVVGKEGEDQTRHDKWLCMMYPRLVLLKQFLREDGVILISLDETELGNLKLIMDEIFGKTNALGTVVWNTRNTDNRIKTHLSPDHEYILVYGKSSLARIEGRIIDRSDFGNPDNDPRGPYVTDPLTGKATAEERPNLHAYSMQQPGTNKIWPPDPAHGWITDKEGYELLLADDRIWWPASTKKGKPRKKRFLSETKSRMPASSFWTEFKSQSGARELDEILGERVFAFPKPIQVVQRVIDYCAPPGCLVLDSFAGSGTTAHAVLRQNAEDGGNRRFILVEMDKAIAENITSARVRKVIGGHKKPDGTEVLGLGSGFRFARLGKTLFDEGGAIRDDVRFQELAEFVFFHETGTPMRKQKKSPLLGVVDGRAIYLLFNGILADLSLDGGNVLTHTILSLLPQHTGPKTIYAASCKLGPGRLHREDIVFKQTPYALRVD